MMYKWTLPLALGAALLVPAVSTARADHRPDRRARFDRRDDYGSRRRALANRADEIARRAHRLHRDGRLSRDHLERTLDKLDRVRHTVHSGHVSGDRFRADMDWLRQVDHTLHEWSRADSGRRHRGDYRFGRYR